MAELGHPRNFNIAEGAGVLMSRLLCWLRRGKSLPPEIAPPAPPDASVIGRHRLAPPLSCELDATPAAQQALFDQVAAIWSALGESDPHWSILPFDQFRADVFSKHQDEFYDPRQAGAAVIEAFFARNGESLAAIKSCLELGCGVGRSTATLARLFSHVVGVDISAAHMALAQDYLARSGLGNVSWQQVRSIGDFDQLPRFDLLFSEIVLQHNPPPVATAILQTLFGKLNPGGYCLFQLATYLNDYRFDIDEYLAGASAPDHRKPKYSIEISIEMHILPQRVVYRLMRDAGIELIEVVEDDLPGHPAFQSLTFFGRKARPNP